MPNIYNSSMIGGVTENYYRQVEKLRLSESRALLKNKFEEYEDLVFIYIPTYNRSEYLLKRSIPSVLSQTHQNFLCLIVGDGCDDDTQEVIRGFNDPRLVYLGLPFRSHRFPDSQENRWFAGPIFPANVALQSVPLHAKWIARIDDDEIWMRNHLEDSIQYAKKFDFEFVTSGAVASYATKPAIEHMGDRIESSYFYPGTTENTSSPLIGTTSTIVYRSYLCNFLYNPECWRKKHNRVNDIDLYVRFFESGVRMGHTGLVTVNSIPREGSEDNLGIKAYLIKNEMP